MLLCIFYVLYIKNNIYCHLKEPRHFFDLRITFASNLPFPIYKGLAVVCTCTAVRGGGADIPGSPLGSYSTSLNSPTDRVWV
jgi:hypothetical protein